MSEEISAALRREVRERAGGRCEYCFMPDTEPLFPHEPDHIIAIKHRGPTTSENLAYACFDCNRAKGSDIAPLDPATGALTPLYNPRTQAWSEHFRFNGPVIEPLTAEGRVTVFLLRFNLPARIAATLAEQFVANRGTKQGAGQAEDPVIQLMRERGHLVDPRAYPPPPRFPGMPAYGSPEWESMMREEIDGDPEDEVDWARINLADFVER